KGFIYNGLGRIHMANARYEQADTSFQQALAIADATGVPHLKIGVYKHLAKYRQLTGNDEAYHQYNDKYLTAVHENTAKHKQYADHLLTRIERQLDRMAASSQALVVAALALFVVMGAGMALYVRRQRKNYRRYQALIKELKSQYTPAPVTAQEAPEREVADREKDIMPEGTKQELLKKLERFESDRKSVV